jgi:hypothetical protein
MERIFFRRGRGEGLDKRGRPDLEEGKYVENPGEGRRKVSYWR